MRKMKIRLLIAHKKKLKEVVELEDENVIFTSLPFIFT